MATLVTIINMTALHFHLRRDSNILNLNIYNTMAYITRFALVLKK